MDSIDPLARTSDPRPAGDRTPSLNEQQRNASRADEKDIVYRASPTAGFLVAEKAVARMLFAKSGSSCLGTGTLLNNSNATKRRMF